MNNLQESMQLVEVLDEETKDSIGYKCPVCQTFFGKYMKEEAKRCYENHQNMLLEVV